MKRSVDFFLFTWEHSHTFEERVTTFFSDCLQLLNETLEAAVFDKDIRGDDMEFYAAVREWATIISHGDFSGYKQRFLEIQAFFGGRCQEAARASSELIGKITEKWLKRIEGGSQS